MTWLPVQIFLSSQFFAVYTVEVCVETSEFRCDCSGYKVRGTCAHEKAIALRLSEGEGIDFDDIVTTQELKEASQSQFRDIMLHRSKIEVL